MGSEIPKGDEITGSIAKELDARFLNRRFFMGQGTIPLTINRIEKVDKLKYETGDTDENVILAYFEETPLPLKLCNTNIDSIIMITGTAKVADWIGVKIGFHNIQGTWFGKTQYAVRVDENWKETKKKEDK